MATKKKQPVKKAREKPVILIVNDDGVTAPGIQNLVEAVKDMGKIVVVAPAQNKNRRQCRNMELHRHPG
jgi:5'-nucleotidase